MFLIAICTIILILIILILIIIDKVHNQSYDGNNIMPKGSIISLNVTNINDIPTGWIICDGKNNTPDLRGRFIISSGGKYLAGNTGGEIVHTLTLPELPPHVHDIINGQTANTGQITYYNSIYTRGYALGGLGNITVEPTGGGQPHDNMPPFYTLLYVMKM